MCCCRKWQHCSNCNAIIWLLYTTMCNFNLRFSYKWASLKQPTPKPHSFILVSKKKKKNLINKICIFSVQNNSSSQLRSVFSGNIFFLVFLLRQLSKFSWQLLFVEECFQFPHFDSSQLTFSTDIICVLSVLHGMDFSTASPCTVWYRPHLFIQIMAKLWTFILTVMNITNTVTSTF